MNLLIKDTSQLLPQHTIAIIDHRRKIRKYRKFITILLLVSIFISVAALVFHQNMSKAAPYMSASLYKNEKKDSLLSAVYQIKTLTGNQLASVIKADNITNPKIYAQASVAELVVDPQVNQQSIQSADSRVLLLHKFLIEHNSPMAGSAATFIEVADKYHINWKLLPSIAGTESGWGQVIPFTAGGAPSYNPFGWGVTGDGSLIAFSSWNQAIETVAQGLVKTYGSTGLSPSGLEETYCPPSYLSDHHWVYTTESFMSEL